MPALGFGTWDLRGREATRAVRFALEAGYRYIDTAEMYGNEEAVGEGIRAADVDRDGVFVTTKIWHNHLQAEALERTVRQSLERLGTGYVDLLLIHWPNPGVPLAETLGAMAELREAGVIRSLGVSNFTVELVEEAAENSPAPVFCNQVEYHPYLSQAPVLECCRHHDILLTAYCPLARGMVFSDETLKEIGERHGKGPGQVALRWLLQQDGVAAIPRSTSENHIEENFHIFDFELADDEMERIFELQRGHRICRAVDIAPPEWDT